MARAASDARDALGEAGAVVIHVDCDIDEYAAATGTTLEEARQYVTDGRFAHILGQTIFLYGPSVEKQPVAIRRQAVYHEYFHALQRFLSTNRSARRGVDRPLWLIEASAKFFEHAVTDRELGGSPATGGSGAAHTIGSIAATIWRRSTAAIDSGTSSGWRSRRRTGGRRSFRSSASPWTRSMTTSRLTRSTLRP